MPSTTKRIVCLANSRKLSGRCIAGKEILADGDIGSWIRPISNCPTEEVSEYERQYEDGSDPNVLDVIDVPLLNASPKNHQQENWLIAADYYWKLANRVDWNFLRRLLDSEEHLWVNGNNSYNGLNDRIATTTLESLDDSLRLIKLPTLDLLVSAGNYKRQLQGRFSHNGIDYWLRITDPKYERKYLQKPNSNYRIGECYLTISLAEPYHGHAYKLIAAIIEPN
ncbi:MAG: hypothetical protein OXI16_06495 [Chloroflexota bacterium]|nr:hypothetical protein [Chloroflexota bacterium]